MTILILYTIQLNLLKLKTLQNGILVVDDEEEPM